MTLRGPEISIECHLWGVNIRFINYLLIITILSKNEAQFMNVSFNSFPSGTLFCIYSDLQTSLAIVVQ